MSSSYGEMAQCCYKNADYLGYLENAKKQYKISESEEDKKEMEKAENIYQLHQEIQEIIKSDHDDYYQLLGVTKDSTIAEIKKAFRVKASRYHPDRAKVEDAGTAMRIIQKAYFEINTQEKKDAYDSKRTIPRFLRNVIVRNTNENDFLNFHRRNQFSFAQNGTRFTFSSSFNDFSTGFDYSSDSFRTIENLYRNIYSHTRPRTIIESQANANYIILIITILIVIFSLV